MRSILENKKHLWGGGQSVDDTAVNGYQNKNNVVPTEEMYSVHVSEFLQQ